MDIYAYDVESFKNLFTVTFVHVDDENDKTQYYIGLEHSDLIKLRSFLNREIILVGYNNKMYDDAVLRYILGYKGSNIPLDVFGLSSKLIDDNFRNDKEILSLRYPRAMNYLWHSIDLMGILGLNKVGISLKQTGINLKWHKIQDIPISPTALVKKNQVETILEYNLNDTLITKRLYEEIEPLRKLRMSLSKLYHIDLTSASDSQIANLILENIYANEFKQDINSIRQMRTNREKLLLGDCIAKFVKFQTPELNDLLKRISSRIVYKYERYRYTDEIYFANCRFVLGVGGLHSKDEAGIFETTDTHVVQDMDVASYYPNLIINNNFYPQHLGPKFIEVLKKITDERLEAKKAGDKVKADGLKITVNSIFGKLGFEYFWLFDAKQFISTTVNGQLGLLMLIEKMYLNGIDVISANTDGIVCVIPKELEKIYYELAEEWERETNLTLEFTPYKKYIRRDVNSYITEKPDGETKEKGVFVRDLDLKRAYRMPIVPKALYEYFINNVPIRDTIEDSRDIMDFCISQKTGDKFVMELHTGSGVEELQKTNRFYVSNSGGKLLKRDKYSGSTTGLHVGALVSILNDYDEKTPFENYDVNHSFYEEEVMKVVREIIPPQMSLFEMNLGDWGRTKRIEADNASFSENTEAKTVEELMKLGKNQRLKRVKVIVEQQEKIEDISSRYFYIRDFDTKTMDIKIYCLSAGVADTLKLDRKAYNKNRIEAEQMIYCEEFGLDSHKNNVIAKYYITDSFEKKTGLELWK